MVALDRVFIYLSAIRLLYPSALNDLKAKPVFEIMGSGKAFLVTVV